MNLILIILFYLSVTIPQGSDAQRECIGYREKVKNAMTAYQVRKGVKRCMIN